MRNLQQDAVELAGLGWEVFPVHTWNTDRCDCYKDCASPAKHPRTKNGLLDATTEINMVSGWWDIWPYANIGVRTGKESGVVVIDIDPRHGGGDAWVELMKGHEYEHAGPICVTGSGGLHLYFEWPEGQIIKNSTGNVGPGIDVRGEGGYVICPPSNHMSGAMYAWSDGFDPWSRDCGPVPEWLLEAMLQRPKAGAGVSQDAGAPIPEGKRRSAMLARAGSMRAYGFGQTAIFNAVMAENAERCVPPLDAREIGTLVADVMVRYEPSASMIVPPSVPGKSGAQRRAEQYVPDPHSFASLRTDQIPKIRWAVQGLLPEGCAMLAGAAKLGKSYASLAVCCQMADGDDVFGYFPSDAGDNLYLALEDGKRRLHNRLGELLPERPWPERAYYENRWPRINEGGKEALEAWLGQHPEARLVIIDTFALFKPEGVGKSKGDVYAEDYAAVRSVKEIADQYGVCILLITHVNKGDHADWVNTMTGSTGLSGAADTLLNMARPDSDRGTENRNEAVLRLTGRDVQEGAWTLQRDGSWWAVVGDLEETQETRQASDTVHFMQMLWEDGYKEVTSKLLRQISNRQINTCNGMLARAARKDMIVRLRQGVYELRKGDQPA